MERSEQLNLDFDGPIPEVPKVEAVDYAKAMENAAEDKEDGDAQHWTAKKKKAN